MRIGAKTITALTLLAAAIAAAGLFGRLRADYLAQLDPWAGFAVGAFAVLTASAVYHLGRLDEPSEHHLWIAAWGSPRVERADPFGRTRARSRWQQRTRGALMRTIYVAVFLQVGLVTIDNRGVALLASTPQAFAPSRHGYCVDDPSPEPEDPRLAGCRLLRRAYELGYAKDLGPCAPTEAEDVEAVCHRRQLDEPYLHYAWRLLAARRSQLVPDAVEGVRTALAKLDERWDHLGALLRSQHDTIAPTPRASHHLFTNLPQPRTGVVGQLVESIDAAACDDRTVNMPPLLDARDHAVSASLVVEHAMGQLLFNPAYPTVVASCREHTIHWNAPPDACDRLLDDPGALLESDGALAAVRAVAARHRRARVRWRLAEDGGRAPPVAQPPPLSRIVSFQCLVVDGTAPDAPVRDATAVVDGRRYGVREVRVRPFGSGVREQIRAFKDLARLFAPGFVYGKLQSQQSLVETDAERTLARRFGDRRDLLTKLELLRESDIFLGHEWIDDHPDLLDVYPYHVHLTNFVEAFRRHYRHARTRL